MSSQTFPTKEKLKVLGLTDDKIKELHQKKSLKIDDLPWQVQLKIASSAFGIPFTDDDIKELNQLVEDEHQTILDRLQRWCKEMTEDHHAFRLFDKKTGLHEFYRYGKRFDEVLKENDVQRQITNQHNTNDHDMLYNIDEFTIFSINTQLKKVKREEVKKSIDQMVKCNEFVYVEF